MKAALFCHAEGDLLDTKIQRELRRQHALLEEYARQQGLFVEYAAVHTDGFHLGSPDRVLRALLSQAQAGEFDMILAESKTCFPFLQLDRLLSVPVYLIQEARWLETGEGGALIYQQPISPPDNVVIYWRQYHI